MDWILNNKEWLFSGIGLSVLGIIGYMFKKQKNNVQKQKSKHSSTQIQGGRDVSVKVGDKNDQS